MRKSTQTSRLVKTTKSKLDSTVCHRVNDAPETSKITKPLRTNKPTIDSDSDSDISGSGSCGDTARKPHGATMPPNHRSSGSDGDKATGKRTKLSNGNFSYGGTPYAKSVNNVHHEVTDVSSLFSPYTISVVCDGINLTSHLEQDDQDIFEKRLTLYKGSLKFKKASRMKPYRKGKNIYYEEELIAKLRYDPIDEFVGYLLLHVNPSKLEKLKDNQVHMLQELFVYLMNDEPWQSFINTASVSLVDIAVDVKNVSIGSVIPIPSRAVNSGSFLTFYTKGGTRLYKQGTQYVGQNQSEKHACIYDKAEELSGKINVVGDTALTRVEVQFKPRVRGRFAHQSPTVSGLSDFHNPLLMLEFAEYNEEADGDDLLKLATALSTFMGATAVLQLISDKAHKAQIKTHLSTPTCAWWKPNQYWLQFLKGLSSHPLFASGLAASD